MRVAQYYDSKTASILKKYGPGPRVHFHIGVFGPGPHDTTVDAEVLRARLVSSQEAMCRRAAKVWDAPRVLSGEVLDAGCGLGGGALYWAMNHGARVTAATIAREHVPLVAAFAQQAGVGHLVRPVLSDVCEVDIGRPFDGVVAMESACYFPREPWFAHLARVVRPGGVVCVEDTFLGRPDWREPFDAYWKTRVAPVREYVNAARAAGFALEIDEDVTDETTEFWVQSLAWTEAMLLANTAPAEEIRLTQSIRWHARFYRAWRDRGIEVRLLRFRHGG
jgi:tocopherol O-methyltransferase